MRFVLVLFFVCAAFAAPSVDEISANKAESDAKAAFYNPMMGGYPGMMDPMMMGGMGMNPMMMGGYPMMDPMMMNMMNPMMGGYPGMGGGMYYNSKREDFPVDYNQGCSSSCSCVQTCRMIWWMPCNCRCPPPCPPPTPPPCPPPSECSCNPCGGPIWMCPPKCCCCNGGCDNNTPQDPEIPEFPFPREDEKKDEPRFPILDDLRNRIAGRNDKEKGDKDYPRYPADIVIRWRD